MSRENYVPQSVSEEFSLSLDEDDYFLCSYEKSNTPSLVCEVETPEAIRQCLPKQTTPQDQLDKKNTNTPLLKQPELVGAQQCALKLDKLDKVIQTVFTFAKEAAQQNDQQLEECMAFTQEGA